MIAVLVSALLLAQTGLEAPIYERLLDYGAIGILTIIGWTLFGPYGVAAIPANDNGTTPTLETVKHLSGQRRRVM